jgi:hypothetical protein
MEEIKLAGSPAELIAAQAREQTSASADSLDAAAPARVREHSVATDAGDEDEPEYGAEPEHLSVEQKEERRQLIRRVGRYRALFPGELVDINTSNLDSLPLQKLRDLSQDVEFLVATRRSAKACRSLFIGGLQGLEVVGPYAGLELKGLSNVAAASEDLLLTVDECAIKYEQMVQIDPLARLAIGVAQLALAVDAHNKRQKDSPPPAPVAAAQAAHATEVPTATASKRNVGEPPHPRVVGQRPTDNILTADFGDL